MRLRLSEETENELDGDDVDDADLCNEAVEAYFSLSLFLFTASTGLGELKECE